ncbi:MAG TPA: preprotein translocase subunit SecE, partial [Pirellulales bacterium]|nr:preprotein translocase subunit SecE [Pirellulales bacterium]
MTAIDKPEPPGTRRVVKDGGGDWIGGLFSAHAYKRSQGRIARQSTFGALFVLFAFGAWSLYGYLVNQMGTATAAGASAGLLLVVMWLSYRLINLPRFADFLISVEAEMNKVSWPTRTELFRSSVVVIVTIFGLAILLFVYDLV